MTDNTDGSQKKVYLIKQPKPAPGDAPAAPARTEEESLAEKRKVVVMKKKVVLKKPQAKVVAHHDAEEGAQDADQATQPQAAPAASSPSVTSPSVATPVRRLPGLSGIRRISRVVHTFNGVKSQMR